MWTASGQTRRVAMEVATRCPGSSSFETKTPATRIWTRTLAREEQCILRFKKKKTTKNQRFWVEMSEETASLSTMAQDVGSSMSYMWIQAGRLDLFIIAPLFVSQPCRTLGASGGSRRAIRLPLRSRGRVAGAAP